MPTFEFTSPEGKTYEISGPEGSTKEQAFQILQQKLSPPKQAEQPIKEDKFVDLKKMIGGEDRAQKMQEFTKELTTRDPSKAGKVTGEQAKENIIGGAESGAVFGGGLGLVLGGPPGAAGGAVMGGIAGAAGGGLKTLAQQFGYGEKTQELADMIGSGAVPAGKGVQLIANNKLVQATTNALYDTAKMMMPKIGAVEKLGKVAERFFPSEPKIAPSQVKDLFVDPTISKEDALFFKQKGIDLPTLKAETKGIGRENIDQFNKDLKEKHGTYVDNGETKDMDVHGLYEKAKTAYDKKIAEVSKEDLAKEFKKISNSLPKASREASMEEIKKIFVNDKGQLLSGDRVINNIQYNSEIFQKLSPEEQKMVRKVVNDFVPGRAEEVARKASEDQFAAIAKDTLPKLFTDGNARKINEQLWNFSKTSEGKKVFLQEFGYYLKGREVSKAQDLWREISPSVNKFIIKDPEQFEKVANLIKTAKSKKDISRATNLLIRPAIISTRQQGEQ
jgi:hypothetical protein